MDLAITLCLGAFTLERTIHTRLALVVTALTLVPIVSFVLAGVEITETLPDGTDELIVLRVILKAIGAEREFAEDVRVAIAVGILIKGGVFEVVPQFVLFEMRVIPLAAIGSICNNLFWLAFQFLEMGDQADRVAECVNDLRQLDIRI